MIRTNNRKTHNHFVLCNFPSRNYRHSIIFSKTRFPAPALPASMIPHGYWRAFCSSSSDSGGPNRHLQAAAGKHFRRLAGRAMPSSPAPQGKKPAVPRSLFHIYNYFSPYYKKSYRLKNGTWNRLFYTRLKGGTQCKCLCPPAASSILSYH